MSKKIAVDYDLQNQSRIQNVPNPINPGDVVNKSYADSLSSGMTPPVDFDASGFPNYPAATAGDRFIVTLAGKVGGASGENVNVGDVIHCKANSAGGDQATAGSDFFIVEGNKEQASETVPGFAVIATQAEVNAGLDDTRIVTPAKMETRMNSKLAAQTYSTTVGDGTNTSFQVTHNLNTVVPTVQVKETTSGDVVEAGITVDDANNITVEFAQAPATNFYTIIAQK